MALLLLTTKYEIEKQSDKLARLRKLESKQRGNFVGMLIFQKEIAELQYHLAKLRKLEVTFPVVGRCNFCKSYWSEPEMRKVCVSYASENSSKECNKLSCLGCLPMRLSGEICESCQGYLCWKCA